ncbi:MAG: hypothetical protein ACTSVV_05940 [Promethearchaeota archaeon]
MSEELNEKIQYVLKRLKNFTNFIELQDFRSFMLFTLNGTVPANILAQFGLGGGREIIHLPYNPKAKVYFQKVSLMKSSNLIVYVKSEKVIDKLIIEKDDEFLKKYLNQNEISLAFRGNEKILFPEFCDCTTLNSNDNSKLKIKIDDVFFSLESFVGYTEPNILFVLESNNDSEPDIVFAFNIAPEIPTLLETNNVKIDLFLDDEHRTRGMTYIKREEDFSITFLKEIKEISHAEIFKSKFALILPIKSFDPYF